MDYIGVGSLTIIVLTGFFTGGVLTLQTYQTLESYGAVDQLGYLVSISLVRELGPVLSALMVTGRVVSAISAELGRDCRYYAAGHHQRAQNGADRKSTRLNSSH